MRLKRKWLLVAAIPAVFLIAFISLSTRVVEDYGAGARGRIVDSHGLPVSNAAVAVTFDSPVFKAITPVRTAQTTTDPSGRFQLLFISCGRPGGMYTLKVSKAGLQTVVIRGQGIGVHRVVLRRSV
jgi:hypothetical protein